MSIEDVLRIHEILVADFAESGDPIYPPGLKSLNLLASAISRQETGSGRTLKYPDPISNAASLTYGLCNNHPFHNGNKRTALVSMLVHLDKNKLTLERTKQSELFEMILMVAKHEFGVARQKRRSRAIALRPSADDEVNGLTEWIRKRVIRVTRGERQIRYRELKAILKRFGIHLENPRNNCIELVRYEKVLTGLFKKREEIRRVHVYTIGWPGENQFMPVSAIKQARRVCKLTEENGVDSNAFYSDEALIDAFINKYRTALRRLANR